MVETWLSCLAPTHIHVVSIESAIFTVHYSHFFAKLIPHLWSVYKSADIKIEMNTDRHNTQSVMAKIRYKYCFIFRCNLLSALFSFSKIFFFFGGDIPHIK